MTFQSPRRGEYRPDFAAKLRFLSPEEGGRRVPAFQGYFPEFTYDDYRVGEYYHIRPLFFREDGTEFEPGEVLPSEVMAFFWIMFPHRRVRIHRPYLKVGVTFTLREAGRITAHGVVTDIIDLHSDWPYNPDDEPPIENLDA